jgi:hypothetical protein
VKSKINYISIWLFPATFSDLALLGRCNEFPGYATNLYVT